MIHPWFEFVYENFTTLCSAFWHATSIVKSHVLPRAKKRVRRSFERGLYFRERNSLGLGSFLPIPNTVASLLRCRKGGISEWSIEKRRREWKLRKMFYIFNVIALLRIVTWRILCNDRRDLYPLSFSDRE